MFRVRRSHCALALAAGLGALPLLARAEEPGGPLTLKQISRDFRWYTRAVNLAHWSDDGKRLYYRLSGKAETDPEEVWEAPVEGEPRQLSEEEEFRLLPGPGGGRGFGGSGIGDGPHEAPHLWSPDRRLRLAVRDGDVLLIDTTAGTARRLTSTPAEAESFPHFVRSGAAVAFRRGVNLWLMELSDRSLQQVTDFRTGPKPKEPDAEPELKTEQEKLLRKQQLELFETLRKQAEQRKLRAERERRRRKLLADPEPYYLPEGKQAAAPVLSPDGAHVLFHLFEPAKDVKTAIVPRFVTESGFTETVSTRAKVGEPRPKSQLMLYTVATGQARPVKVPENGKSFSYGTARWSPDGRRAIVAGWSLDLKDRWILGVDPAEGRAHVIDDWHDPAWIGGPGSDEAFWMPDGERVYFLSEIDGWSHLYVAPYAGGQRRQLTAGRFEVSDVQLSRDGKRWFLVANEKHPGELHLYTMPVEGGERQCVTSRLEGVNTAVLSPDERRVAVVYSRLDRPAEIGVLECRPGAELRPITRVATEAFLGRRWIVPEIVTLPDRDGNLLYARLYRPREPHPTRPAVIQVHGAGYAQAAHKRWASGNFLFANFLAEQGYHVLDLDYRGSSGYGRECRTAIYRHMGGADIESAVAAVDYLQRECRVDPKRIGITGGSYGGFFTLMALFTRPGVFAAGASLFPVTDWSHYNHWYTSRILNNPDADPEAYRRSSPIYHAAGLRDRLLILHGLADDNVHAQDTIRLAQKLIELEKEGWDVAVYPTEGHGFTTPATRYDSYRRTFELFENTLKK